MQSCEVVLFVSSIACTISKCYTDEEIAFFASAFSQLGDSLVTILTHKAMCNKDDKKGQTNEASPEKK